MSAGDPPKVSIGLPVYNGERFLTQALDSLLAQTFTDFEVIICDNASTDSTAAICQSYVGRDSRIRYYRNDKNVGAARNFNRTFELARGEYFKWFAHDDMLAPTYLEKCVDALDKLPKSVVLCFPRRYMMTPDGKLLDHDPYLVRTFFERGEAFHDISFARLVMVDASRFPIFVFGLMRTAAARKTRLIGAFIASDLIFSAEMRLVGRFHEIPEQLYYQRLHEATPEVLARTERRGDAAWFDPDNAKKRVMPETRLMIEYVRSIRRTDLPVGRKLACYAALSGHLAVRAHRGLVRLPKRLLRGVWSAWTSLSREMVRVAPFNDIPIRTWLLLSALRRRDQRRIKAAFGSGGNGTRETLLSFSADRLIARNDPVGHRMILDWLIGEDNVQRRAAARALSRHVPRFGASVQQRIIADPSALPVEVLINEFEQVGPPEHARKWTALLRNGTGACDAPAAPSVSSSMSVTSS